MNIRYCNDWRGGESCARPTHFYSLERAWYRLIRWRIGSGRVIVGAVVSTIGYFLPVYFLFEASFFVDDCYH